MWVWRLMLWWKKAIKLLIWPNYGKLCQMIYINQKKHFYFVIFTYSGSLFPQRELPQPPLSSLCCSPLAFIARHCKQGWPSAITFYMRKQHRNDLQYLDASPPWDTLVETVRFTDEVSSQYFVTECLTHSWIRNNRLIDVDQRLRINIRAHMLSLVRKPTIKYHGPQHGPQPPSRLNICAIHTFLAYNKWSTIINDCSLVSGLLERQIKGTSRLTVGQWKQLVIQPVSLSSPVLLLKGCQLSWP